MSFNPFNNYSIDNEFRNRNTIDSNKRQPKSFEDYNKVNEYNENMFEKNRKRKRDDKGHLIETNIKQKDNYYKSDKSYNSGGKNHWNNNSYYSKNYNDYTKYNKNKYKDNTWKDKANEAPLPNNGAKKMYSSDPKFNNRGTYMKEFSEFYNKTKQNDSLDPHTSTGNSDQEKLKYFKLRHQEIIPQANMKTNKRLFVSKWLEKKNNMYSGLADYKKLYPVLNMDEKINENRNTNYTNIEIELLNDTQAIIRTSIFVSPNIKNLLNTIRAEYSQLKKGYVIDIDKLDELYKIIDDKNNGIKNTVSKIPIWVIEAVKNQKIPYKSRYDYYNEILPNFDSLPQSFRNKLFNFQEEGIKFGLEHHGRVFIGDEMGVGKTIQAIGISWLFKHEMPALIICPASLKMNWKEEIIKFLPELSYKDVYIVPTIKDGLGNEENMDIFVTATKYKNTHRYIQMKLNNPEYNDVKKCKYFIVSYNMAMYLANKLMQKHFKIVIVDESHTLKNTQSKTYMTLSPLMKQARRTILLTGTPMLAKPMELYPQLTSVRPDLFPYFLPYGQRYCNPIKSYYGIDYSGSANTKELHVLLQNTVMIRRLKSDVLGELPPKLRQRIFINTDVKMMESVSEQLVDMLGRVHDSLGRQFSHDVKQSALVNNLKNKLFGDLGDNSDQTVADVDTCIQEMIKNVDNDYISKSNIVNRSANITDDRVIQSVLKLWDLTGQAKLVGIKEYIKDLLNSKIKFIIFAHHVPVLDAIEDCLIVLKTRYIRIDGRTPHFERHKFVTTFQNCDDCKVAVLSITAANTGLTLTATNLVVFAEMHWTPGIMIQAEDRAHRIGQKYSVNIHYLFAKGTLDSTMYMRLIKKLAIVSKTLDGKETLLNAKTVELQNGKQQIGSTDKFIQNAKKESESKLKSKNNGKQIESNAVKNINKKTTFKTMNLKNYFAPKNQSNANDNKTEKKEKTEVKGEVKQETKTEVKSEDNNTVVKKETNEHTNENTNNNDARFKAECEYVDAKTEVNNEMNVQEYINNHTDTNERDGHTCNDNNIDINVKEEVEFDEFEDTKFIDLEEDKEWTTENDQIDLNMEHISKEYLELFKQTNENISDENGYNIKENEEFNDLQY